MHLAPLGDAVQFSKFFFTDFFFLFTAHGLITQDDSVRQ
jgi:hypothetical protein